VKYLYIDNFRGFNNTIIPIKDVNFLVGENSTGKSSVLSLIHLLSLPPFWFTQTFGTEGMELGNFDDIVSANAKDRSYFRVGLLEISSGDEHKPQPCSDGFLLTFVRIGGMPEVSRYTFIDNERLVHSRIGPKRIYYRNENVTHVRDEITEVMQLFQSWIERHKRPTTGYRLLKRPPSFTRSQILPLIPIVSALNKSKGSAKSPSSIHLPILFDDIAFLAPIRTEPKRTYDSYKSDFTPAGTHTPYLIKGLLSEKRSKSDFLQFVEKFGRASGLFESVSVKNYGSHSVTSPFELDVILNGRYLNVSNVGYGVSQSLPVIVELFARKESSWILVQQPEIHLHPKAQVALGDVFYKLATQENKKFIIETHTDFIIDSFRLNYGSDSKATPLAQVIFFERTDDGNTAYPIEILNDGSLSETQPPSYREFFLREQMRLLRLD